MKNDDIGRQYAFKQQYYFNININHIDVVMTSVDEQSTAGKIYKNPNIRVDSKDTLIESSAYV